MYDDLGIELHTQCILYSLINNFDYPIVVFSDCKDTKKIFEYYIVNNNGKLLQLGRNITSKIENAIYEFYVMTKSIGIVQSVGSGMGYNSGWSSYSSSNHF